VKAKMTAEVEAAASIPTASPEPSLSRHSTPTSVGADVPFPDISDPESEMDVNLSFKRKSKGKSRAIGEFAPI
jgi:hypothetical protein